MTGQGSGEYNYNMTQDIFENTLRTHLRRKPFFPFMVEMLDGKVVIIERPALAIGGDSAALITDDDELIEFGCEEVRVIRLVPIEAVP